MINIDKIKNQVQILSNNNINKDLAKLYCENWPDYEKLINYNNSIEKIWHEHYNSGRYANIYLLATSDAYNNADFRIMFLGKETMGWGGEFDKEILPPNIKDLMSLYDLFINHDLGNPGSAFHRFVNRFRGIINCKQIGVICNNVIKVGKKSKTGFYKSAKDLVVLKEEIDILNPDLVVCPLSYKADYMNILEQHLGKPSLAPKSNSLIKIYNYPTFKSIPNQANI